MQQTNKQTDYQPLFLDRNSTKEGQEGPGSQL